MFHRDVTSWNWLVRRKVNARCGWALILGLFVAFGPAPAVAVDPWIVLEGEAGPGVGKHVVLVSGDEEYRSEETLPQLAKILANRHGFKCTVLFAIDPADGSIDPNNGNNIPGLEALAKADLAVFFLRFRNLPDAQMKHVVDYIESGRPIIGLRTATHAFNLAGESAYRKYTWNNGDKGYEGGFGRQVLGETWISHHGNHGSQSTRGIVVPGKEGHPILRGIKSGDVWGPTDVYGIRLPLPGDSDPLLLGEVLEGMKFEDKPIPGPKNEPRMPVAWVKSYRGSNGKTSRVFTTTMGASQDFSNEGVRRLLVNACYWAVGLEERIPPRSNVELVGRFEPLPFKFNGAAKGVKPADLLK